MKKKSTRGFASIKSRDPEYFKQITSQGGKKSKPWMKGDSDTAREIANRRWKKYREDKLLKEEGRETWQEVD